MWMSIFSSFEALSAESLSQKVALSLPTNTKQQQAATAVKGSDDDLSNKGKDSSQPIKKPADGSRRMRAPRFAPELDGIHCFETILPY